MQWSARALKELMAHPRGDSLLVKDTCLQLVRLVVGDDKELTRVFTTTTTSVEAATLSSGLWCRLPHTSECDKVKERGLSSFGQGLGSFLEPSDGSSQMG